MIEPILIEKRSLLIHPFRAQDLENYKSLIADIFAILSDEHTLKYLPTKRLNSMLEAEELLKVFVLSSYSGRNHVYFISDIEKDNVIGMIELIPPGVAKEFYTLKKYPFFIEFYLKGSAAGCYIMTEVLPLIIAEMSKKGVTDIGAVVNRENVAARKVLERSSFFYHSPFDIQQDFYHLA